MINSIVLFCILSFSFGAVEDDDFPPAKSEPKSCPNFASQIPIQLELEVIPGLSQFVDTFQQELEKPGILRIVFERAIEVFKNREKFYALQLSAAIKFGMKRPVTVANEVMNSILYNLDILKPSVLTKALLRSIGRILYECGFLTSDSAVKLSQQYANAFKQLALLYGPNQSNEVFLGIAEDGALVFFYALNIRDFNLSDRFAMYFVQEMYSLKNNI